MLNRLKVNKFLKLSPIFLFILFLIMMYLYSNKNITHASVIKVENKKINSSSELEGKKIINDGVTEMNEGNYKKALELFDKALPLLPQKLKWSVYYNKALLYEKMNDSQKAIIEFEQALKLNPDCEYCYSSLGYDYHSIGQEQKALENYNKGITFNPEYYVTYYYRGRYYENKKEYLKSIEDYKKSIELNSNFVNNYTNIIGDLIVSNKLDEAQLYVNKLSKIISNKDVLNYQNYNDYQCQISYFKKEYEKALPFCATTVSNYNKYLKQGKEITEYDRISSVIYYYLIDCYALTGQFQKSLDTTYELIELAKKHNDKKTLADLEEEIKFLNKKLNMK